MMNRRHHHTCRCNECVRRRNAHRRRRESADGDRGRPRPSGSTWYEVERDEPVIYEDEVRHREETERQQRQDLERILATVLPQSEECVREREPVEPRRRENNEERWRRHQEQYLETARQEREEEEQRRRARQGSREAARQREEEERTRQVAAQSPAENVEAARVASASLPTVSTSGPPRRRRTGKSAVALILLALVLLIIISVAGFFCVLYLHQRSSQATATTNEPISASGLLWQRRL